MMMDDSRRWRETIASLSLSLLDLDPEISASIATTINGETLICINELLIRVVAEKLQLSLGEEEVRNPWRERSSLLGAMEFTSLLKKFAHHVFVEIPNRRINIAKEY